MKPSFVAVPAEREGVFHIRDADSNPVCTTDQARARWMIEQLNGYPMLAAQRDKMVDVIINLLQELSETVKDAGGCDHGVGICCCRTIRIMDDATNILKKFGVLMAIEHPWSKVGGPTDAQIHDIIFRLHNHEPINEGIPHWLFTFAAVTIDAGHERFDEFKSLWVYFIWTYKLFPVK